MQLQSIDYDVDEDVSSEPQPHSSTSKMMEKIEKKTVFAKQPSSSSNAAYNVALSGMLKVSA